jgi:hypothetical protein
MGFWLLYPSQRCLEFRSHVSYFLYQCYLSSCTHLWTKDYSKMEGVPDYPIPCLKRHELNFSHVEMGSLIRQALAVPINFGPPQAEGTGESDGLPCKDYTDTSTSSFLCSPPPPPNIIGRFLIPLTLLSLFLLSVRLLGGLQVCRFHTMHI